MLATFVRRIDQYLLFAENRRGLLLTSIAVGFMLMMLAAIYVTPAYEIKPNVRSLIFGAEYQAMSIDPFDFSHPKRVQMRILTPLLAHVLHLRGRLFIYFPLLVAGLFLASIYHYFRRDGWSPGEALGAAATMAFSMPILFLLHYAGHTDVMSYLLLFGAIVYIRKNYIWPVLFCLALFNHEGNIVAAPWLILLAAGNRFKPKQLIIAILLLAAACIPLILFRHFVLQSVDVELTHKYYLDKSRLAGGILQGGKLLLLGVFESFKLFWIFPLIGIYATWKRRAHGDSLWFILVMLCTFGQFLLASDIGRLSSMAFPAVLMGIREARYFWVKGEFGNWLWGIILLNFLVPQYYAGRGILVAMWPLPVSLILLLFGLDAWDVRIW
jgi:hypothetical protein